MREDGAVEEKTILLVEDTQDNREIHETALRNDGYAVVPTAD